DVRWPIAPRTRVASGAVHTGLVVVWSAPDRLVSHFSFNPRAPAEIDTLSLHDALPIFQRDGQVGDRGQEPAGSDVGAGRCDVGGGYESVGGSERGDVLVARALVDLVEEDGPALQAGFARVLDPVEVGVLEHLAADGP